HLMVDELVSAGDLGRPIQHQYFSEESVLEQDEMLVLGARFVEHPIDFVGHAEAELVEQRFGHPALAGHGRSGDGGQMTDDGNGADFRSPSSGVRHPSSDQAPCPRTISLTSTRCALNASRNTGMQASGLALPHMKTSSAA